MCICDKYIEISITGSPQPGAPLVSTLSNPAISRQQSTEHTPGTDGRNRVGSLFLYWDNVHM